MKTGEEILTSTEISLSLYLKMHAIFSLETLISIYQKLVILQILLSRTLLT